MDNQKLLEHSLENLLLANLKENRTRRRWSIFFKAFFAIYLSILLLWFLLPSSRSSHAAKGPHSSLVDIKGMIMPGSQSSADKVVGSLAKAFKDPQTKGVILRINSPGGSPVQAAYIYDNIMRLRQKYPEKKIHAVCVDVCASAAYYIASATNDIYANPSSLVGSIGVMLNGFGFVDAMQKIGVTRRLLTAGTEKGFLDPFSPMTAQNKQFAQHILDSVHQQFIQAVKKGRGHRLSKNPKLFSGLAWSGAQAKPLGLVDEFGSAGYVARHVIKQPKIVNYTQRTSFFERFSQRLGMNISQSLLGMLNNVHLN